MEPQDVFTKVITEEVEKLLADICLNQTVLYIKIDNHENLYKLTVLRQEAGKNLILKPVEDLPDLLQKTEAVLSVQVAAEKYYASITLTQRPDGLYSATLVGAVYQLQRRQHFRLRLPQSFKTSFQVSHINKQARQLKFDVHDLSAGGCRLQLRGDLPILKSGDLMEGKLLMQGRPPIDLILEVRHVKHDGTEGMEEQLLGTQFANPSPALEGRMTSLIMELHRKFFAMKNS